MTTTPTPEGKTPASQPTSHDSQGNPQYERDLSKRPSIVGDTRDLGDARAFQPSPARSDKDAERAQQLSEIWRKKGKNGDIVIGPKPEGEGWEAFTIPGFAPYQGNWPDFGALDGQAITSNETVPVERSVLLKLTNLGRRYFASLFDEPRYFMDHGVLHDRVTGQHMWTQDEYDAHGRANYADGVQDQMGGTAMPWAVKRASDTIGHLLAAQESAPSIEADLCRDLGMMNLVLDQTREKLAQADAYIEKLEAERATAGNAAPTDATSVAAPGDLPTNDEIYAEVNRLREKLVGYVELGHLDLLAKNWRHGDYVKLYARPFGPHRPTEPVYATPPSGPRGLKDAALLAVAARVRLDGDADKLIAFARGVLSEVARPSPIEQMPVIRIPLG